MLCTMYVRLCLGKWLAALAPAHAHANTGTEAAHYHLHFCCAQTSSGAMRMVWKTSIDLSCPAVSSMGNLDPYDGLVTCTLLQQAADRMGLDVADTVGVDQGAGDGRSRVLQEEIADFQSIVDARYKRWVCVGMCGWRWGVRVSAGFDLCNSGP